VGLPGRTTHKAVAPSRNLKALGHNERTHQRPPGHGLQDSGRAPNRVRALPHRQEGHQGLQAQNALIEIRLVVDFWESLLDAVPSALDVSTA